MVSLLRLFLIFLSAFGFGSGIIIMINNFNRSDIFILAFVITIFSAIIWLSVVYAINISNKEL